MSTPEDIAATTESAKTITAINKDSVHKICSGQVNKSLYTIHSWKWDGIFFNSSTKTIHTYKNCMLNVWAKKNWVSVFLCMLKQIMNFHGI